jgi:hypothetical protein
MRRRTLDARWLIADAIMLPHGSVRLLHLFVPSIATLRFTFTQWRKVLFVAFFLVL